MNQRPSLLPLKIYCSLILSGIFLNPLHAQQDIEDIPSQKYQLKNELVYFTIGDIAQSPPKEGFKILIVLPGGDGSESFLPFVKRIYQNCLNEDYLIIQPVARKWTSKQFVTWPTKKLKVKRMKTSTEEFIELAIKDLNSKTEINQKHISAIGWSSGGPAVYATALQEDSPITGSFIAMSIFKPELVSKLSNAKNRHFYILHSKEDQVTPYWMANKANQLLKENGANVNFVNYSGGHGWQGDVFGNIREGLTWLEEQNNGPNKNPN